MKITKPGFYFDVSAVDYFADPCPQPSLTQSICKVLLDQSPLHARCEHPRFAEAHEDDDEEKYEKVKAIGNAAHSILIGRGKELAIGKWPDWKTKEARAFKSEQSKNGKTPILEKHSAIAVSMVRAARRQLDASGWNEAFTDGHGEVVAAWQEDGIWFRTMIDWMTPDKRFLYDLKSGGVSFAPHVIGMHMVKQGWDIQAAMHERAMNALDPDGAGRRKFRFVAIENYLPFALVPVEMTETWLTMGRKKLDMAFQIWRHAIETNNFQGYPSFVQKPEYPSFKETEWLGRETEYAERPKAGKMLMDLSGG